MKLSVIFTGGTIGSQTQENGWIAPNRTEPYQLLTRYCERYPDKAERIEFDCSMPYQILSENLSAEHLMKLVETIQEQLQKNCYDGILVCHGTDTLQYTAAILSYVFADAEVPILLISSNYPMEDSRANGLVNFQYGIETIQNQLQGVFVVYRNSDGKTYVHRGNALLAHQTFEDNLYSVQNRYAGVYEEDGRWIPNPHTEARVEKVTYHGLMPVTDSILWLRVCPGMAYPKLSPAIKVILLESYHSGTIAVHQELEVFVKEAREAGISIYLVGAVSGSSGYETIQNYQRLGIQVLEQEAPIAVYCRMWLELSVFFDVALNSYIKNRKSGTEDDKRKS